ncbi:MAG: hypothetical protein OHK0046_23240 [Anaerolineae bacterium]
METSIPQKINGLAIDHTPVKLDVAQLQWRPSVYALIFNARGELLVMDNLYNGKLDYPGGGVEVWETLEASLIREIWEETGLEAEIGELIHTAEGFFLTPSGKHWHTLLLYYRATVTGGELRSTIFEDERSVNPHWVNPKTLASHQLTIGYDALQIALRRTQT